jgi:hypothetical protein
MPSKAKRAFDKGKQRLELRKQRAASSLSLLPPFPEEIGIIHDLYLKAQKIREVNELAQLQLLNQQISSSSSSVAVSSSSGLDNSATSRESERKICWMKSTIFKTTQYMHMQVSSSFIIVQLSLSLFPVFFAFLVSSFLILRSF